MAGENSKMQPPVELVQVSPRRRWTTNQKIRMIEESYAPGNTISLVARRNGINPNLLYKWRRQMQQGGEMAIEADDVVVSQAEVRDLKKRIQQLERCLGDKTLEVEILKEAVRIGREKKLISRQPLCGIENFQ